MVVDGSSRVFWLGVVTLLGRLFFSEAAVGQDPALPADDNVALIRVHLPLTGNADQVLQQRLGRTCDRLLANARRRKDARRPILVLQLVAHDGVGSGSQFERAFALARFLCSRQMAGVKTVAFLPRSVRGHAALLPLACEEIIMAPGAELGEAGVDETAEGTIHQTVVAAYREIAETRRTIPVALAVGMIDPAAEVLQVETETGVHFVLRNNLATFAKEHEIVDEKVLVPAGTMAQFSGREGRQFGFVKYLATDHQGVTRALGVADGSLDEAEMLVVDWRPVMIDVRGPITARLANQVETMLTTSLEQRINWIGLRIDSAGGDLAASMRLANTLARLDPNSVRTVAYLPAEAAGGAALVALACDQLVMHPTARLAAVGRLDQQKTNDDLAAARVAIRGSLAPAVEKSWSLLAAMIDPSIEIFQYHNKATGATRLMSAKESLEQPDSDAWQRGQPLVAERQTLRLDGLRAAKLNLASQTVESFDELRQLFGLAHDPPTIEPNWALEFIEALASPEFSIILLMMGFAGIYFELRTPGLGIGAFVGSVSLLLFFWSQYLHGTAGWLEILLFVGGLCFVSLEIFVVPGFGIFGLGGGAMVIASLVLASLTFVRPHSENDMEELVRSISMVALAGAGVMAFVVVSHRYLPRSPLMRGVILTPPPPEEQALLDNREALADYSEFVGAQGIATTDLRPSGKAEINHELVDVIAEGEPIDRGSPLIVIEAHANRVIVRATGPA